MTASAASSSASVMSVAAEQSGSSCTGSGTGADVAGAPTGSAASTAGWLIPPSAVPVSKSSGQSGTGNLLLEVDETRADVRRRPEAADPAAAGLDQLQVGSGE